jgi:hypothetical protein
MKIKKFEDIEYIKKSDVDELVRSRITKVSERARVSEERVKELELKMEQSRPQSESNLAQSKKAYAEHQTITQYGFTDPNLRDMVSWTYEREMKNRPKKDQQKLGEWLQAMKDDPSLAPSTIAPHLTATNPAPATPQPETKSLDPHAVETSIHPSNGVVQPQGVMDRNLIDSALRDPEIYKAKREEIKATWYSQRGKPGPF